MPIYKNYAQQSQEIQVRGARCKGKGLPANTLATTPHQCTAIDSCWEKLLELQTDQKN